ncbi:MAG: V-type ATPase 116kDa subunit family protein, partial [Actinomycetota bacterium]|nr:V-type ATPase 116kDa subunit family protein [Actinomycetota bacterium]
HLPTSTVDEVARQKHYLELWQLDSKALAAQVTEVIEQVEDKTSSLAQAQSSMEAELALLARYEPILQKIQPLAKQIVTTGAYDSVALLVERRYKGALEMLKKELDEITKNQCEIVSTDVDEDTTAVIVVFGRKYSEAVHKFLAMENVNQIRLPSEFQDMPFDAAYDELRRRRTELPTQLEQVKVELSEMSSQWYMQLSTIRDVLVDKIEEISAIPKFGQTEYAFVITGWLPVDDVKQFRRTIIETFSTDVIVNQLEVDVHEYAETPVQLHNPKFAAPYEWLLGKLKDGPPQYGTIDPTVILAITYPLFFGMIVGDIGYGAIMLGLILWLRNKYKATPGMQMATSILGPAATSAILFGFFYGEFFGDWLLPARLDLVIPIPLWGDFSLPYVRTHDVYPLIYMVLAVGVIQIAFGLVLGVVNAVKGKHMKHAYIKGGLLGFILGIILLVAGSVLADSGVSPVLRAAGAIVLGGGVLVALRFGAVMGFVEILETFSSRASYIRSMAVGISGAIFADAINELASSVGLVAGILAGVVFHSLHLVLAAFTPNIHALRLNFLEFFGKFYETSKQEYKPFHKTGGEKRA